MKIRAYIGDITHSTCDAIVNAAHEGLTGGGGVDGAIHRAAGPRLYQYCRDLPQVSKGVRCPVGEARITPGFNLPARQVIHTVAPRFVGSATHVPGVLEPIYKSAVPGGELELKRCYDNCLTLADKSGCKTVVFSSLGTGGHSWPIEMASEIAVGRVVGFLKGFRGEVKSIERIEFCCFTQPDLWHYMNEFDRNRIKINMETFPDGQVREFESNCEYGS